jgi:FMN phosphatase YigB (HAD superfamily)
VSVRWAVFDVGGVLVDETRMWRGWAEALGIGFDALWAALREDIAAGQSHLHTMRRLSPGTDIPALRRARLAEDAPRKADVFPDVRMALAGLATQGIGIGIAGNQPAGVAEALEALALPARFIATSARWGVAKPDAAFFARVSEACGVPPGEILYVGDRMDNDIAPALAAGMRAALIPRGLWSGIHDPGDVPTLAGLSALPDLVRGLASR